MEPAVEQLLSKEIMEEALSHFTLRPEYRKLGDFENYVFEVYRNDMPYILRITHSTHRSEDEIKAELDWINFLHFEQVNVPKAYESKNGRMVEAINAADGSVFYCSLFSKVIGEPVKITSKLFNEKLFFAWGKTIGRMHHATKKYTLTENIKRRASWDEDDLLEIENYVPAQDTVIIQHTKELVNQLTTLPKNSDNFGLIHSDIHSGNFFFDGEEIHVFDFDDSCYLWFSSDIAIPVYYSALYRYPQGNKNERNAFANMFMKSFMEGYKTESQPPKQWKEQLPLFLRLRDMTLYSVLYKKIPLEERNEEINKLLEEIKKRIESNEAIVDIH
ncbi:phosphotransferase [Ornithinibacillus sp. L9]|uniref:Phosphotransferase n=1 Tax=Ornithinibacillus caprae TaxID=2678566 RepID=A0A6N8FIX7_9BACI|nr:phosphotransferase [Ornithinibacillus caprae]MUK87927.1 phosphotransferase [Ornithinibacillus caprae]